MCHVQKNASIIPAVLGINESWSRSLSSFVKLTNYAVCQEVKEQCGKHGKKPTPSSQEGWFTCLFLFVMILKDVFTFYFIPSSEKVF